MTAISRGLGLLAGALPLTLSIDNPYQVVGGKATYRLAGAPPGATVMWTSFKNGKETGELRATYGQTVEANGTLELTSEAWRTDDVGNWVKQIEVIDEAGKSTTAYVAFTVTEAAAPASNTPSPYQQAPSNVWFTIGDFAVTPGIGIALIVGAFLFFKGR